MIWYVLASLGPAALLVPACILGGAWAWAALLAVTLLVFALDHAAPPDLAAREDGAARRIGLRLSLVLVLVHFLLLALGVRALSGAVPLTPAQTAALFLGLGVYFGQVSNANAHELIHAPGRWPRRAGAAVFISLLFGHHVSAHLRVHHLWAATPRDPNSARMGEGLYHFITRAWRGSFIEGWRAETALRAGRNPLSHPYAAYTGGALAALALAYAGAGWRGLAALVGLASYAQVQLLISDYVQHYGLTRRLRADGKFEPAGPAHAWNAAPWFSGAMLLNAPRHSDHHMHPARPFPALRPADGAAMPLLPSSFPAMGLLAAFPPLWRQVMDPRAAAFAPGGGGAGARDLPDSPPC